MLEVGQSILRIDSRITSRVAKSSFCLADQRLMEPCQTFLFLPPYLCFLSLGIFAPSRVDCAEQSSAVEHHKTTFLQFDELGRDYPPRKRTLMQATTIQTDRQMTIQIPY